MEMQHTLSAQLSAQTAQVHPDTIREFESRYSDWMSTVRTDPRIAMSSNPKIARKCDEFRSLVAMGKEIVPLIVEKLTNSNSKEFFALQAYEELVDDDSLTEKISADDPRILEGEQGRAIRTAHRWAS